MTSKITRDALASWKLSISPTDQQKQQWKNGTRLFRFTIKYKGKEFSINLQEWLLYERVAKGIFRKMIRVYNKNGEITEEDIRNIFPNLKYKLSPFDMAIDSCLNTQYKDKVSNV